MTRSGKGRARTGWIGEAELIAFSKAEAKRRKVFDTWGADADTDKYQELSDAATSASVVSNEIHRDGIEMCAICSERIKDCRLSALAEIPYEKECRHGFCEPCIKKWFAAAVIKVKNDETGEEEVHQMWATCPTCRMPSNYYLKIPGPFDPDHFDYN